MKIKTSQILSCELLVANERNVVLTRVLPASLLAPSEQTEWYSQNFNAEHAIRCYLTQMFVFFSLLIANVTVENNRTTLTHIQNSEFVYKNTSSKNRPIKLSI